MAYVEEIDPTTPGANDPAEFGDDQIRALKTAINERMEDITDGWPDTDPIKLKGRALGDVFSAFMPYATDTPVMVFTGPHSFQLYRVYAIAVNAGDAGYSYHRGLMIRHQNGDLTLVDMVAANALIPAVTLSIAGSTLQVRHNDNIITPREVHVKIERVL
jgi:hypothetical protein